MKSNLVSNKEYKRWLAELKFKVCNAQLKAAVKVNSEMLLFYWELGEDIAVKQVLTKWGDAFLSQHSKDLMLEFPDMKGFSERNLKYIRQWFIFYSKDRTIRQQAVAQITQIPWGHNIAIISKCKNYCNILSCSLFNLFHFIRS